MKVYKGFDLLLICHLLYQFFSIKKAFEMQQNCNQNRPRMQEMVSRVSRSAEAYIPDKIRNAYSVTVQFSRKITSKWNRLLSITFAIKGHKCVQENWWGQIVINLLPYNMIFRWINLRGRPFDILGGGGGGWVIFQKKSCLWF